MDVEVSPPARLWGYAPVLTANGYVAADDSTYRFLSMMVDHPVVPMVRWHQDVDWTLGIPASDGRVVFTGVGGEGASRAIMALDSATGGLKWAFTPGKLNPDPARLVTTVLPKTYSILVGEPIPGAQGAPGVGVPRRGVGRGAAGRLIPQEGPGRPSPRLGSGPSRIPPSAAALEQYAAQPTRFREVVRQAAIPVSSPVSTLPPGHWTNSGLVLKGGRLYGEAGGEMVALDASTGSPVWRYPLGEREVARSVVASADHLLFCVSKTTNGARTPLWARDQPGEHRLVALRLDNGKVEWSRKVARPGSLALAGGLVFFTDGDLHVYGPGGGQEMEQAAARANSSR